MTDLMSLLPRRAQRGSKPRCHWFTHGPRESVAERLTTLASPYGQVRAGDSWMPEGFDELAEAELDKAESLLGSKQREELKNWWLPPGEDPLRTPNFDIANTCVIDGRPGLLLVEAKAHAEELNGEAVGRRLSENDSEERRASHETIGAAIEEARVGLSEATGHRFQISRDSHYQMANRFAWAWKLTELGVPVVLVYLGFLQAQEMKDRGAVLESDAAWQSLVREHSKSLVPDEVWGSKWRVNDQPFVALIRSAQISLKGD